MLPRSAKCEKIYKVSCAWHFKTDGLQERRIPKDFWYYIFCICVFVPGIIYLLNLLSIDRVFRGFEKDYASKFLKPPPQPEPPRTSPAVSKRHSATYSRKGSASSSHQVAFQLPGSPTPVTATNNNHTTTPNTPPVTPPTPPTPPTTQPTTVLTEPLSVAIKRSEFMSLMRYALHVYVSRFLLFSGSKFHCRQDYTEPRRLSDFHIACDVQDRKYSFTILLGGTSGCGKSTLAGIISIPF